MKCINVNFAKLLADSLGILKNLKANTKNVKICVKLLDKIFNLCLKSNSHEFEYHVPCGSYNDLIFS